MRFPIRYSCLGRSQFEKGEFKLIPIRYQDRIKIMSWRNEQIYHLRQARLLTVKDQDHYFQNQVSELFSQKNPDQILFSLIRKNECIGYGGLVHLNWVDKNAEISFIMNTDLEKKEFESNWINFLQLIEKVGFEELKFHKLYVYAFDLRPHLYRVLEKASYFEDARLHQHHLFEEKFIDAVIYSKVNL